MIPLSSDFSDCLPNDSSETSTESVVSTDVPEAWNCCAEVLARKGRELLKNHPVAFFSGAIFVGVTVAWVIDGLDSMRTRLSKK